MVHEINYNILADALNYYKNLGYQYIEVPWYVNQEIANITADKQNSEFILNNGKVLVGSAEQSFLSLDLEKNKKYVSLTPCFRDDIEDEIHQKTFMKVELFISSKYKENYIDNIIYDAKWFFHRFTNEKIELVEIVEGFSYDLMLKNVEIGSYGFRSFNDFYWYYGTGVAEPRFSNILD